MRNFVAGFIAGLVLCGVVWASGPTVFPPVPPPPGSRPDQRWQQDRGSSVTEYLQRRQQEGLHEQRESQLQQEIERLKHQPC
jgi:hypothetical protein